MSTTTAQKVHNLTKSNVASAAIVSKTWSITNNTGTDVVVMDAFVSDAASTDVLYQRSLQLLSTSDNQQVIKAGETKTIFLAPEHTDSNGKAVDYTIIIARADNLFPVKIVESEAGGDSFPDTVVTDDDARLMKGAENLVKAITAFPSSKMATAFGNVLPTNDEGQIGAFFKSYPQYGAITLDHVVAVQTYYYRYGFVWAGYAATQTFDIWTSADGTTKKNLGTVTITSSVVTPVTNPDTPAGFTATYMDVNHRKTTLYYTNGQFSEDVASSSPKICLQGLFVLLGQLTGQGTDNRLVPTLNGVVNGAKVFGVSSNYPSASTINAGLMSAAPTTTDVKDYFDSLGLYSWLKLAGIVVGTIAGVVLSAVVARYIYKRVKKGAAPELTPEQIKRQYTEKITKTLERMVDAGVAIPADLTKSLADIKAQADANLLMDNRAKIERILQKQYNETNKMMEYGNTSKLQSTFESLDWDRSVISTITDPKDMAAHIDLIRENIAKNAKVLADRGSSISNKLSASDSKIISDAKEVADTLSRAVDTNEKIREDLLEDEFPEIIED